MCQTITVSDTPFVTLAEAAKAGDIPLERLLESLSNDVQMQPIGQQHTGETFLGCLGTGDKIIKSVIAKVGFVVLLGQQHII